MNEEQNREYHIAELSERTGISRAQLRRLSADQLAGHYTEMAVGRPDRRRLDKQLQHAGFDSGPAEGVAAGSISMTFEGRDPDAAAKGAARLFVEHGPQFFPGNR